MNMRRVVLFIIIILQITFFTEGYGIFRIIRCQNLYISEKFPNIAQEFISNKTLAI